ncbi:MAG: hypothetical protein ACHQHN_00540 [Sphingobacteriales bacterium]
MKKLLLLLLVFSGSVLTTFAQSSSGKARFSAGFELGLPAGTSSNIYNIGWGGSLKYEIPVARQTMFTITGGVTSFAAKLNNFSYTDSFVPLKAGLKYYLSQGFYAEGQLGVAFYVGSDGVFSYFAYSPGIGYTFNGHFDLGARYEGWVKSGGTLSQLALRAAYNF